jgi:hypothetical protein
MPLGAAHSPSPCARGTQQNKQAECVVWHACAVNICHAPLPIVAGSVCASTQQRYPPCWIPVGQVSLHEMLEPLQVICMDNFFTGTKENVAHLLNKPNFELIRHDVVNPILLEVDEIFHLACPASPVHYKCARNVTEHLQTPASVCA